MTIDPDSPLYVELDEYLTLIQSYDAMKSHMGQVETELDDLKAMLLKLLPTQDEAPNGIIATVGQQERLSYKPYGARQVSLTTLRSRYPTVAAECTEWVTRWRFLVKPVDS